MQDLNWFIQDLSSFSMDVIMQIWHCEPVLTYKKLVLRKRHLHR